jgi:hypothetical protein
MAEAKKDAPAYGKGDRVAITGGRQGVGVRGDIFWIGENKYGPGWRYGVKGDDGETYWLDEAHVGDEKEAPPPPEGSQPSTEEFDKGDRVRIRAGEDKGVVGSVFWVGESKFGKGQRYGIRGDDEDTYWADQAQVEASDEPAPGGKKSESRPPAKAARNEFSDDDAPLPEDPGTFEAPPPDDDDYLAADGGEEGDPNDIPF